MDDLIAKIEANPGTRELQLVGRRLAAASVWPLVVDAFGVESANTALIHLPFRGGGAAATAVITGNADFICTNSSALPATSRTACCAR